MYLGLKNVTIKYDKRTVIDNLSLEIEKGKITALIGKNGAGKSTIIKALSGAIKPIDGDAILEDKRLREYKGKEIAKMIGYLPQIADEFLDMDVYTMVSYGRFPHKKLGFSLNDYDRDLINKALKQVGLIDYRDKPLCKLSGGERQRAWIAMILVQESKILILDEPTTYLDIGFSLELLNLIRRLNKELGLTILMSLHDINLATSYADNTIMLQDGRVAYEGPTKEVINSHNLEEIFDSSMKSICDNDMTYFIPYRKEPDDEK